MINHIAITDWSSTAHDHEGAYIAAALNSELPDFCAAWGLSKIKATYFDKDVELASKDAILCSLVDDDGFVGTAGVHMAIAGVPLMLCEKRFGAWVVAHECYETPVNPDLGRWATAPDGRRHWVETADATQADGYAVEVDVFGNKRWITMSNWLAPAWFGLSNADGSDRLDKMRLCKAPFEIRPGGYSETITPGGRPERLGATVPSWGMASKRSEQLRFMRTWGIRTTWTR